MADARQVKSYILQQWSGKEKKVSKKSAHPAPSASEDSELGASGRFNSNEEEDSGSSESAREPETHAFDFSLTLSLVETVKPDKSLNVHNRVSK